MMPLRYEEDVCRAWLASFQLPSEQLGDLLSRFEGRAAEIYRLFHEQDQLFREIIPPELRAHMIQNGGAARMNEWADLLSRHRIQTVDFLDPRWPSLLGEIQDPPRILFYQGNPDRLQAERKLAVFGSRRASYLGQRAAAGLAKALSDAGVVIVSGLAYGIDTSAHQGCLQGKSPTIAVMGCGLDQVYPAGNAKLKDAILAGGGLLISEYPPGEKPLSWHFPVRNRIISGLCSGVILMEARLRSGSMRTVGHAADQGREVFAYPGDPESPAFEANWQLLREGARFFTKPEHILEDLGWLDNPAEVSHNIGCAQERNLPPEQAAVLNALRRGALGFDQLIAATGLGAAGLMSALTLMQIQGLVEALPGKMYQIRR